MSTQKFQLGETVAIRQANFNQWESGIITAIMIVDTSFAYQIDDMGIWHDQGELYKAKIIRKDASPSVTQQSTPTKKD